MAKRARRMQRNGLVTSVALIGVGVVGGLFLARWLAIKGRELTAGTATPAAPSLVSPTALPAYASSKPGDTIN